MTHTHKLIVFQIDLGTYLRNKCLLQQPYNPTEINVFIIEFLDNVFYPLTVLVTFVYGRVELHHQIREACHDHY